jgi:hypothetical protein
MIGAPDDVLTLSEAGALVGLTDHNLRSAAKRGELAAWSVRGKGLCCTRRAVLAYADRRRRGDDERPGMWPSRKANAAGSTRPHTGWG